MSDLKTARPRNHLGEPATKTPDETIARLKEALALIERKTTRGS